MHVKTTKVKKGNRIYEYLSLVQAKRVDGHIRQTTIARLGEASVLRDSGELERIVDALRRHLDADWVRVEDLDATGAPALGAAAVVAAYWERLGLDGHYGAAADAVFAMVANRLCDPCSKRRTPEWAEADVAMPEGFTYPPLHRYYRALDVVADNKDDTEQHLYGRLTTLANLDLRLVCYDITSTYFEGSTVAGSALLSPASCNGPGVRQLHGTTCEGGGVGGVMLAEGLVVVKRGGVGWLRGQIGSGGSAQLVWVVGSHLRCR